MPLEWIIEEPGKTGQSVTPITPENPYGIQPQQGIATSLAKELGGVGTGLVKGVAQIPSTAFNVGLRLDQYLRKLIGQPTLTEEQRTSLENVGPTIQESIEKNLPAAQTTGGKFASKVAERIPAQFLLGSSGIGMATKLAAGGEAGKQAAKKLGFGDWGQFIGDIAGSTTAGVLPSRNYLRGIVEKARKQDYQNLFTKGAGVNVPSKDLNNYFTKQFDDLSKGIGKGVSWKKDIMDELTEFAPKLKSGSVTLDDLVAAEIDLNGLARTAREPRAQAIYGKMSDFVSDEIKKYGSKVPGFLDDYRRGQSFTKLLHTADKANNLIDKTAQELTAKNILKNKTIGQITRLGYNTIAQPLRYSADKDFRKLYAKVYAEAALNNPGGVANALKNLDKAYTKSEEKGDVNKLDWIIE